MTCSHLDFKKEENRNNVSDVKHGVMGHGRKSEKKIQFYMPLAKLSYAVTATKIVFVSNDISLCRQVTEISARMGDVAGSHVMTLPANATTSYEPRQRLTMHVSFASISWLSGKMHLAVSLGCLAFAIALIFFNLLATVTTIHE